MLECARKIQGYTTEGEDAFLDSPVVQDAVIRNFEVMGEAAKRVSARLRESHPAIPWRRIAGFRDVLIHGYEGVSAEEVWGIVENDLDGLVAALEYLLAALPDHGS